MRGILILTRKSLLFRFAQLVIIVRVVKKTVALKLIIAMLAQITFEVAEYYGEKGVQGDPCQNMRRIFPSPQFQV